MCKRINRSTENIIKLMCLQESGARRTFATCAAKLALVDLISSLPKLARAMRKRT